MSETLAVKYRPKSFVELTEQASIQKILAYQISSGTIKQAYLFTGPAGCGKTTSARIFATMINGEIGDILELDAASNNSVDAIRNICKQSETMSQISKYKVFILDEVHCLSQQAWQAMLKTLEEPPKHAIFILCTTNPEKIPETILSRVQRYNFQKISTKGIEDRLNQILQMENDESLANGQDCKYSWDHESTSYIARLSEGGMRDAISLLDKCLSYSKNLTVSNIVDALGVANYDDMFRLTSLLYAQNVSGIIEMVDTIYSNGISLTQFCQDYFEFVMDVCNYIQLRNFELIKIPSTRQEQLEKFTDKLTFFLNLLQEVMQINGMLRYEKNLKYYLQARLSLFVEKLK